MLAPHIAILAVIIPLLSAPFCAVLTKGRLAWLIATIATWSAFAVSLILLVKVNQFGVLTYAMGNWPAPFGIEYRIDLLGAFMLMLVSGIGSVAMPFALRSVASEIEEEKQSLFYTVYLLCLAGLLGIISTNDAFNIFVFLEISSLSTYTLIAMSSHRKSLLASFEYLILGTIGATFYLIGVGLLYMVTGTLNISDLASRLPELYGNTTVIAAFSFIMIGLALKFALFPLHLWLCNAYTYAPSFVSAFLAATATKASLYVLIRMLFTLFGAEFSFQTMPLSLVFIVLALFAMITGSLVAIFQTNIKRLLAYSSVAQIGYIVLGISLNSEMGLTAAVVHLFNHAIAKGALFLVMGCVFYRLGGIRLNDFRGLGKHMPYTMAAFVVAGFSLIGMPLTSGFISKWYLVSALLEKDMWLVLIPLIISSLMAIIYIWRVVEVAYFKERPANAPMVKEAPLSLLVPCWVLAGANIVFGIYTAPTVGIATRIASQLIGGAQ